METKHTPGPWYLGGKPNHKAPLNNNPPRVWAGDHAGIADVCTRRPIGSGVSSEEIANGHLIAAAPDLLAALETMLSASEGATLPRNLMIHLTEARAQARDALKRAKGEA